MASMTAASTTALVPDPNTFSQTSVRIHSVMPSWDLDAWKFTPVGARGPYPVIVMSVDQFEVIVGNPDLTL